VKKEIMIAAKEVQELTQQALKHNQKIMMGKHDPNCQGFEASKDDETPRMCRRKVKEALKFG
jgi:hypothetical protein